MQENKYHLTLCKKYILAYAMNIDPTLEPVRDRLTAASCNGSKADQSLASYMLAELNGIAFDTAASLAAKVGVSEPTVGRFCRSLGYKSFKDLKSHLQADLGDKPWLISDRLREMQARARAGEHQLSRGMEMEMAGLVSVYELAHTPDWSRVAKRLATVERVYVAGFQTERGVAQIFANQLQYLRDGVHLIDLAGGNFAELLASDEPGRCLVVFEARRYSRLARVLAAEAKAVDIPTTLVTDPFCDWGRALVDEMFVVPTQFGQFWESSALMASLSNLLVNSVFLEIGPAVEARLERIQALHAHFTGYVGGSSPSAGDNPLSDTSSPRSDAIECPNNNDNRDTDDDDSDTNDARNGAGDLGPGGDADGKRGDGAVRDGGAAGR